MPPTHRCLLYFSPPSNQRWVSGNFRNLAVLRLAGQNALWSRLSSLNRHRFLSSPRPTLANVFWGARILESLPCRLNSSARPRYFERIFFPVSGRWRRAGSQFLAAGFSRRPMGLLIRPKACSELSPGPARKRKAKTQPNRRQFGGGGLRVFFGGVSDRDIFCRGANSAVMMIFHNPEAVRRNSAGNATPGWQFSVAIERADCPRRPPNGTAEIGVAAPVVSRVGHGRHFCAMRVAAVLFWMAR